MTINKMSYKEAVLNKTHFSVTWEIVPGRGSKEKQQDKAIEAAKQAAGDPRVNAFTITDNPSGKPAIMPYPLAQEILQETGGETLYHFTCKDKNRNEIESQLHAMNRVGLKNLLVMTGDYTTEGFLGRPKPVFDIDAVHAIKMIRKMNEGFEIPGRKKSTYLSKTDFFIGAVVSPFKAQEPEQMAQYYKMHQKYDNGAQYFITQLGWDARKFHELRLYTKKYGIDAPLIGNIFVLSVPVAKMMNQNLIPGCVVTDKMLKELVAEKEQFPDDNHHMQLLRSAKLYAILKGMGYDGVTIAGPGMSYEDLCYLLDKGEEMVPQWKELVKEFDYPMDNGFYFFEKDAATGLNTDTPVDRSKTGHKKANLMTWFFGTFHHLFFSEDALFYPVVSYFAKKIDKGFLKTPFTWFEYYSKTFMNECRFCGDCVMHELGYQCPMSKCPKNQRNGACGGSRDGWCEVYPGKQRCIYVEMYEQYKAKDKEYSMKLRYVPPANWDLYKTSSWLNFFNKRDYNYRQDD